MKKNILGLIIGSMVLISCSSDEGNENPQPQGNNPVNGSEWIFKISKFNESGSVIDSFNVTLVASETTIGGSTWLNLVEQSGNTTAISIQKRTDGWWFIPSSETQASLWYKTPATEGETYQNFYGTCVVVETDTSIVLPAGVFENVSFIEGYDTNSLENEYWFTDEGPVLIKQNTYDQVSGQPDQSVVYKKESWELISFTQ